jgi:hypothetical protein
MASQEQINAAKEELRKTFSLWNLPGVLSGALSLYWIPYLGAKWALPNRPFVALTVSVISLTMSIVVAWWLAHSLTRRTPTVLVIGVFAAAIVVSIGSFAGLSATIYTWRPTSYSLTASEPLLPVASESENLITADDPVGLFSHYYQLVLLDFIPGLEATKTMTINHPVEIKSRLGGLPVLGFKIYILIAVVGAFKKWRELRKEQTGNATAT